MASIATISTPAMPITIFFDLPIKLSLSLSGCAIHPFWVNDQFDSR
jgi:hypothetical protein